MRSGTGRRGRLAYAVQVCVVAAAVCLSLGTTAATDLTEHFNKLGQKLMCSCGCAQQLMGCDHVGCPNREGEMDQLRTGIAGGMTDQAILDGFVERWGATVLSAPTTKGFDLVAWIMPFAVAAAALIGTILLVRNWAKHEPKLARAKLTPGQVKAEDEMLERIRRETGTEEGV